MRVARVVLPSRSHFDLKCLKNDRDAASNTGQLVLSLGTEVLGDALPGSERELAGRLRQFAPSILHIYGSGRVPHALVSAARAPWLADRPLAVSRPLFGRSPDPQARALGLSVPEPVDVEYFESRAQRPPASRPRVGSLRQSPRTAVSRDLVDARIRRFRDDVDWILFDAPPSPAQMAQLDLWVDLSSDDVELDGLVTEALVLGLPVVAARTDANVLRTGDGRAAMLCPKGDPNEMAHAVVTMLFKPERREPFIAAAGSLRDRFRPEARRAALARVYAEIAR